VRAAVAAANADSAKGHIDQGDQRYEVISNDQASKAADYRDLVIAYRNGSAVLLHDVAEVVDSNENIRNAGLYNGKPTVGVIVFPLPGRQHHQDGRPDQEGAAVGRGDAAAQYPGHVAIDRSQSVRRRWAIPSAA
jgi:multidrug efflux pump